eukprot:TRINITY_DN3537_c0_g1_i1.p1 TRINITY_DN3537_c0_g1~~TRINITY_DN3537_c0_g1_i1.p1  ORF type:complete len:682 (+),score=137.48 TRINITY_DN3537_c0_g1_i1:26-2047(+)
MDQREVVSLVFDGSKFKNRGKKSASGGRRAISEVIASEAVTAVSEHFSMSRELATKLLDDCRVSGYIFCLGDAGRPFTDSDSLTFAKFTVSDLTTLADELDCEMKKIQQLSQLGYMLPRRIEDNPLYWQLRAVETEARFNCLADRLRLLCPSGKGVTEMSSSDSVSESSSAGDLSAAAKRIRQYTNASRFSEKAMDRFHEKHGSAEYNKDDLWYESTDDDSVRRMRSGSHLTSTKSKDMRRFKDEKKLEDKKKHDDLKHHPKEKSRPQSGPSPFKYSLDNKPIQMTLKGGAKKVNGLPHVLDLNAIAITATGATPLETKPLTPEQEFFQKTFAIETEYSLFDSEGYTINVYENLYLRDIRGNPHTCWVGKLDGVEPEYTVAYVKDIPEENEGHILVVNTREGFKAHRIPQAAIPEGLQRRKGKAMAALEEYLDKKFKLSFYLVREESEFLLSEELTSIEEMHGVNKTKFLLSAVYCKVNQIQPLEMMANTEADLSEAAKKFFKLMDITTDAEPTEEGKPGQRAYEWHGRTIIWHYSPNLNEEQQRRLIGNDNAVLFFKDEGEPFNPINVNDMGIMTQCYVVVQPYEEDSYRVAFFHRKNIDKPYGPSPMRGLVISSQDIKDFVLTKLHNASLACLLCPPLLNLIARPRAATMTEIIDRQNLKGKLLLNKQHRK